MLSTAYAKSVKYPMSENKKSAYFDCFSGISGDMCLGALIDAGADIDIIKNELAKLPVSSYSISHSKVIRSGISATKADVIIKKTEGRKQTEAKKWKDIEKIIKNSHLSEKIKQKGLHIFKRLFEAEAMVHGTSFDDVHLHELGGIDCIVDIFGTLIGLDILGIEEFYTSAINLGSGTVKTEHGILPVPAPATAELLKGYAVYSSGIPFELTTPTGAAIISGLDAKNSNFPELLIEKTGYGAGNREISDIPNVLRIFIGKKEDTTDNSVTIIETNIDDMNPQIYEDVMDKLFMAGALDVFLENIIMKKGRPAIKLSVIASDRDRDRLTEMLFKETTTIGVRFYNVNRKTLDRQIKTMKTSFGNIRMKISKLNDEILNISPEYEDIKDLSKKTGIPIKEILKRVSREDKW